MALALLCTGLTFGVAKNVTLIAVRALDCRGESSYSDVLMVSSSSQLSPLVHSAVDHMNTFVVVRAFTEDAKLHTPQVIMILLLLLVSRERVRCEQGHSATVLTNTRCPQAPVGCSIDGLIID